MKWSLAVGDQDPRLTQCSVVPQVCSLQTAFWSVQPFLHNENELSRVTDRQTLKSSVTIVCISCIRCSLKHAIYRLTSVIAYYSVWKPFRIAWLFETFYIRRQTFVLKQRMWEWRGTEWVGVSGSGWGRVEPDLDGCWVCSDVADWTLMLTPITAHRHVFRYSRPLVYDCRQPVTVLALCLRVINVTHWVMNIGETISL